jgi:hypothetical protein
MQNCFGMPGIQPALCGVLEEASPVTCKCALRLAKDAFFLTASTSHLFHRFDLLLRNIPLTPFS